MNSSFQEKMQRGVAQYNTARQEGDMDLVNEVRMLLNANGLQGKVIELYNTDKFIVEAEGKAPNIQRFLLNRYWNQQLMCSQANSMDQRYCLIPNGEVIDWLRLFKESVMPFILQNNLPIRVQ